MNKRNEKRNMITYSVFSFCILDKIRDVTFKYINFKELYKATNGH